MGATVPKIAWLFDHRIEDKNIFEDIRTPDLIFGKNEHYQGDPVIVLFKKNFVANKNLLPTDQTYQ